MARSVADRPATREPAAAQRADAGWRWWEDVVLRGTGFPADSVRRLASPALAAAADGLGPAPRPEAWEHFAATFAEETTRIARRLQEIGRDARFQEAVTWQNYRVLETGIEPFLRWRPGVENRHRKHRAREHLVASYWQRYCVKNDSIGFFGPIGWAKLSAEAPHTILEAGPTLVERCVVRFESWAIDALAAELGRDPRLRRWLPPRRIPYLRVTGSDVFLPSQPPVAVRAEEALVLEACDGRRAAWQVAEAVVGEAAGLDSEDAVLSLLDELARRRFVVWALELPVDPRPELALRATLEPIGDEGVRRPALEKLSALESARDRVASAGHDASSLRRRLIELEELFAGLTRVEGTRNEGQTYAARTILYKDCRRNVSLVLGADFARALEPVELLLESARWLTHETALQVRRSLLDVFRAGAGPDSQPVPLSSFWFECMPILHGSAVRAVDEIQAELQRRWQEILRPEPGERRVHRSVADLRDRVLEAFAAPASGWDGARYYSPDVMVAASSVDELRAGDFRLVLGEFHLAINTLRHTCFVHLHPSPRRLLESIDRDFPLPRLLPILPKESPPRLTARLHPALVRESDFLVGLLHMSVDPARPRVVASSEVSVRERDGMLDVTLPTGETFDALDVFSEALMGLVFDRFRLFGEVEHAPRVTIDKVVASRETWSFDPAELGFATAKDEARAFVQARAWAREVGLPREVFVKSPLEEKPFYVDFASPIYVSLLAKGVRRAASTDGGSAAPVRVTEMLPRTDEVWLTDRAGARYASELRLVAFDLRTPALAGRWSS